MVCMLSEEKLNSLDDDVFQIMKNCEAIITHDVKVKQLLIDMVGMQLARIEE